MVPTADAASAERKTNLRYLMKRSSESAMKWLDAACSPRVAAADSLPFPAIL